MLAFVVKLFVVFLLKASLLKYLIYLSHSPSVKLYFWTTLCQSRVQQFSHVPSFWCCLSIGISTHLTATSVSGCWFLSGTRSPTGTLCWCSQPLLMACPIGTWGFLIHMQQRCSCTISQWLGYASQYMLSQLAYYFLLLCLHRLLLLCCASC